MHKKTTLTFDFSHRKTGKSERGFRVVLSSRFSFLSRVAAGLVLLAPSPGTAAPDGAASPDRSSSPDWSANARISPEGRPNPYGWDDKTLQEKIRAGKIHALRYPIPVTGLLIPARPALKALNAKPGDLLFGILRAALSLNSDFQDFEGFWRWLGLHDYPKTEGDIPFPDGQRPKYPMGVSILSRGGAEGFTLSCAACHSSQLFGKPILGLTNRFPRANLFFIHGQSALEKISPELFALATGATPGEKAMYADSRSRMGSIGLKRPETVGLDTSLAQVALSLARRAPTPRAERDPKWARTPRPTSLDHLIPDSKPAAWWNVKYKTRFLSDASVISGNPVFTNFLWNEIGRGVDLPELVSWLESQSGIVEELTTAVFATQAPKWGDYLDASSIKIERAKRGEKIFNANCNHCHGTYDKAWATEKSAEKTDRPLIETVKVHYFEKTGVKDVGTDPGRLLGMKALAEALNPLEFSQRFGIVIEEQKGYVAPPLEGIWARFPYFHNNSIPSLCALMTPPEQRPVVYRSGEVLDRNRDFDQECVGYPVGPAEPEAWSKVIDSADHLYDTRRPGMSNAGHYERIFRNKDGSERYTAEQKKDLVEFLKTL